MAKQEKTEKATPKKREDARKKDGMVAKSQDLTTGVIFTFGFLVLRIWGPDVFKRCALLLTGTINIAGHADGSAAAVAAVNSAIVSIMSLMAPFVLALGAIGFLVNALQVKLKFTPASLKFKGDRINVGKGLKRMLGPKTLVELAKNVMKFLVVASVAFFAIRQGYVELHTMGGAGAAQLFVMYMQLVFGMALKVGVALMFIGALDYGYQRWEFEKSIRMTKQEVKEEFKQTEGDPNLRAAIKSRMRQLSRQRMLSDVEKATFVVANPTHLAIALEYSRGMRAPKVLAKGMNFVAERIKEEAEKHNIPIVEDKPLAQTMYKMVEVGQEIPPDLYKAVAEVLAYVMSMDRSVASKVA
jgi:flagellar biosynthetic protein FlhB